MCVEYRTITTNHRMLFDLGVTLPSDPPQDDLFPLAMAPFVRKVRGDANTLECISANFGLIPSWAKDRKFARNCYNARTETVSEKPS